MSYRCLADFLEELGHAGELLRVDTEVDPVLEAAEITGRVAAGNNSALLFGSLKGHDIPVLTNLLGSEARICRALGVTTLTELADRIAALLHPDQPEGWLERLKTAPQAAALSQVRPRRIKSAPCQQVVRLGRDVDLGRLPLLQSALNEAGRAMTGAVVITAEPDSHQPLAGRYDLQLLGADRLAACWAAHDEPARLLRQYGQRQEKMPVALVLGGDPTVLLAATASLPPGADVCALAGLFRQKSLDVVACRSVDLEVPAESEIVIEGYIDPSQPLATAGPLCTPLGYYSLPRPAPVVQVTAVTHRANPICPAIVPGRPPHEACAMERALARVFLPLTRLAIPELVACDLPMCGAARYWALLAIEKSYAGQARQVACKAWGLRQFMFAKLLVVVDADVNVHDLQETMAAVAANMNPSRDLFFQQGPPDPWDPSTPPGTLGQRIAIDATAKLPDEHAGTWPSPATMSEEIRTLVSERWTEYSIGAEDEGRG
jgi:4-hydroxy-3-polyprenylbenzoate decarboxylase